MKNSEKKSVNVLKGSLIAGALFGVSALGATTSSSLFSYEVLGSGAEVRSEILSSETTPHANFDMNCGEKEGKESKESKEKAKEAKCGEGKCGEGEKKKEAKEGEAKKKEKAKEGKSKEAKCGEGKCGEGKCGSK